MKIKLKPYIEIIYGNKNSILYDLSKEKIYLLNKSAAQIMALLKEWHTKDSIITAFKKFFAHHSDSIESDVIDVLNFCKTIGILTNNEDDNFKLDFLRNIEQYPLKRVWCELTNNCNLKCFHCYAEAGEKNTQDLDIKNIYSFLAGISKKGCKELQLTGGEPFLRKDIWEIVSYIKTLNIDSIEIFTNLTLVTKNDIKLMKEYGVKIATTFLGPNEEIHDLLTQKKGSFTHLISTAELIQEQEIQLQAAIIVVRQNEKHVAQIKKFLSKRQIKYRTPDDVRPVGRGKNENICPLNCESKRTTPDFKLNRSTFYYAQQFNSCWGHLLMMRADGKIILCPHARDFVIGDIKQQSMDEILNSDLLKKYWTLTVDQIDTCRDCEYRYFCEDCRPLAFYENTGLYSKMPRCTYNPYKGMWNQ